MVRVRFSRVRRRAGDRLADDRQAIALSLCPLPIKIVKCDIPV
jgi:hypothetical protein